MENLLDKLFNAVKTALIITVILMLPMSFIALCYELFLFLIGRGENLIPALILFFVMFIALSIIIAREGDSKIIF